MPIKGLENEEEFSSNTEDFDGVLNAINQEIKSEEIEFFGHKVNRAECVAYIVTLRGISRGQPPKMIEESGCDGFPSEAHIIQAISSHDGIEKKLKARKFVNTGGVYIVDCEFRYHKNQLDPTIYSLIIRPEVSLENGSGTEEALNLIRQAREIMATREKELAELKDQLTKMYEDRILKLTTHYEAALRHERQMHAETLKAEREHWARVVGFCETMVKEMQRTLTAAVEARTGQSPGDRALAEMQQKLLGAYEESLKELSGAGGGNPTAQGTIASVERGLGTINTLMRTAQQFKGFFGEPNSSSPAPAPTGPVFSSTPPPPGTPKPPT